MGIELRFDNTGVGEVVVACIHCGEDIRDPRGGLAVWMPEEDRTDPVAGTVFCVDYAHNDCEDDFVDRLLRAEEKAGAKQAMDKINVPLPELFDHLRKPLPPDQREQPGTNG